MLHRAATHAPASVLQQQQQQQQQRQLTELLEAKKALDATPAAPQHQHQRALAWRRLVEATEAVGRHEAAYILAARAAGELDAQAAAAAGHHHHHHHRHMFLQQRLHLLGVLAAAPPPPLLPPNGGGEASGAAASTAAHHHPHHHPHPHHWHRYASRYYRDATRPRGSARVLCVSDLHVDAPGAAGAAARAWVAAVDARAFLGDVLIVAGDVCDGPSPQARAALAALRPKFARLCYVPGNHELWCGGGGGSGGNSGSTATSSSGGGGDSFARLMELRLAADELDVDVAPFMAAAGLVIVPLLSWYDAAFDAADPRPGRLRFDKFCRWPVGDGDVWQVMARLNAPYLASPDGAPHRLAAAAGAGGALNGSSGNSPNSNCHSHRNGNGPATAANDVVTASHFLPHRALPSAPGVPELRKAVGCGALLRQAAAVGACAHVFGHTHINGSWLLADDDGSGSGGGGGGTAISGANTAAARPQLQCRRRYTQHALADALEASGSGSGGAGGALPGLAMVHDGKGPVYRGLVSIKTGEVVV